MIKEISFSNTNSKAFLIFLVFFNVFLLSFYLANINTLKYSINKFINRNNSTGNFFIGFQIEDVKNESKIFNANENELLLNNNDSTIKNNSIGIIKNSTNETIISSAPESINIKQIQNETCSYNIDMKNETGTVFF